MNSIDSLRGVVIFSKADDDQPVPVLPKPSHQTRPSWIDKLKPEADGIDDLRNSTVKMCMPFTDALGFGWVLRAPETVNLTCSGSSCDTDHEPTASSFGTTESPPVVTELRDVPPVTQPKIAYHAPTHLVETGWDITTPDGVSLLVVPPMNRSEPRFTPLSFLAEMDTNTHPMRIPLVAHESSITIEEGDVIAQVIPIVRDDLLSPPELTPYGSDSNFAEHVSRLKDISDARSSFYRQELWENKPSTTVITDAEELDSLTRDESNPQSEREHLHSHTNQDASNAVDKRSFIPSGEEQVFYAKEDQIDLIRKPKPAQECIPQEYLNNLTRVLDGVEKNPLVEWIENAMSLGMMFPFPRDTHIYRDDGGLHAENEGQRRLDIMDEEMIGQHHPHAPFSPVNMTGEWTPVLPKGYSNLYISPLNHHQTDFTFFSGIVDSDRHLSTVNIPGRLREHIDETNIHSGLPTTQAIPIKRDSIVNTAYVDQR